MDLFSPPDRIWPALSLASWKETYDTLHLWTQVVGKIPLKLSPRINHWWQVAYRVTPRGLTTQPIYHDKRCFELEFDFLDHALRIRTAEGMGRSLALVSQPVADFYSEVMDLLRSLKIDIAIDPMPKEIPDPIPFDRDRVNASYDPEYANRHWRILLQAQRLLTEFRAGFTGKCSPVHFFWGSFDLCVTFFSGRPAPARPGADLITREAYSQEVISFGFWPGSGNVRDPAFYSYAAPEPPGFAESPILPRQAFYNTPTHGRILMYDDVRRSPDPDRMVLDFLHSSFVEASELAHWGMRMSKVA